MDDSRQSDAALDEAVRPRVETDLGHGFVRLMTAEAERRQAAHDIRSSEDVVIELLRNARDAHASHIFLATAREGDRRRIVVVDDGDGIPRDMFSRVFEPRVTSKLDAVHMDKWGVHGRGMALYSIAVNAASACVADSVEGGGASIAVETDVLKLRERRDQSAYPSFRVEGESGNVLVTGPRNIARTACEFALDCRGRCSVCYGSPTEIAAALLAYGRARLTRRDRLFAGDARTAPVCLRLALAQGPDEFAQVAGGLGLELSSRSARRVLDGIIAAPPSLLERIARQLKGEGERAAEEPAGDPTPSEGRKGKAGGGAAAGRVRFSPEELEALGERVLEAYEPLAQAYYLTADVQPLIRVAKGDLVVRIPLHR